MIPFVDGAAKLFYPLDSGRYCKPFTPVRALLFAGVVLGLIGCKDLTGSQALPAGTTDPSFYNNKQGALLERNTALVSFFGALANYILDAGFITDELQDPSTLASAGTILQNVNNIANPLDERLLGSSSTSSSEDGSLSYQYLQATRGFTSQALGMLATYDTAAADLEGQKIMRAELYALTGYSEILLADLFCSGVPLSTLDFQRDFTYHASSSTADVYNAARAQFDTALTLADTSTQIQNLARVGKGRAYLDLGQYDSAANVVQSVPDGFSYQISSVTPPEWNDNCFFDSPNCDEQTGLKFVMSDTEGRNGLPFLSSRDPRSAGSPIFFNNGTDSVLFPFKYRGVLTSNNSMLTLTVASSVEARLIQAEAALKGGDATWLTILKTLHDTLPGVTPLADPGTTLSGTAADSSRVALLFQERAEWLYLTGSRQGDLRRLLRQYGQYWINSDRVYPTGIYPGIGAGKYGTDVTAPIPASESVNPLFHGCLSRAP